MVALSGVGVASMLSGESGVSVPLAGMLGADIHKAWLANTPTATPHASSSSSAVVAQASTIVQTAPAASNADANDAPVPAAVAEGSSEGAKKNASTGMTEDGKVILNLASVEDLRHLPGVGQKRAGAILVLRTRLGRFKQVNDLLRVKGIGVRGLKKIMPHVVLDAPKPAT